MRSFRIILEDCLMKLIYLSVQCCCDCLSLLFWWAYINGYIPFISSDYVHVVCSYSLKVACLHRLADLKTKLARKRKQCHENNT